MINKSNLLLAGAAVAAGQLSDCCSVGQCSNQAILDCLKTFDPFCLNTAYDQQCVHEAQTPVCGLECNVDYMHGPYYGADTATILGGSPTYRPEEMPLDGNQAAARLPIIDTYMDGFDWNAYHDEVMAEIELEQEEGEGGDQRSVRAGFSADKLKLLVPTGVRVVKRQQVGAFDVDCPTGMVPISCTFESVVESSSDQNWAAYPSTNAVSCSFKNNAGIIGYATCVKSDLLEDYSTQSVSSGSGTWSVDCPSGTTVMGCGLNNNGDGAEPYPKVFPYQNGGGCTCYNFYGGVCYATCSSSVNNFAVVQAEGTTPSLTCDQSRKSFALGCGVQMGGGTNEYEKFPAAHVVYPSLREDTCTCYGYYGVTCYAICGTIKGVSPPNEVVLKSAKKIVHSLESKLEAAFKNAVRTAEEKAAEGVGNQASADCTTTSDCSGYKHNVCYKTVEGVGKCQKFNWGKAECCKSNKCNNDGDCDRQKGTENQMTGKCFQTQKNLHGNPRLLWVRKRKPWL